jgi:hypothetical protein
MIKTICKKKAHLTNKASDPLISNTAPSLQLHKDMVCGKMTSDWIKVHSAVEQADDHIKDDGENDA